MNCPVCETIAGNYRIQVNGSYSIIKCANCGLEYTDPIPREEELNLFYSTYEDIRAERDIVELNAKEHLKTLTKRELCEINPHPGFKIMEKFFQIPNSKELILIKLNLF